MTKFAAAVTVTEDPIGNCKDVGVMDFHIKQKT